MPAPSSVRNCVPQRKYRERAQPTARAKLGLLPKKKDYKLRAKHQHAKEDFIDSMKLKAALKNDDEFYFKMQKSRKNEEDGMVHIDQDDPEEFNTREYRELLKRQNYREVVMQKAITENKIGRMQSDLHLLSTGVNCQQQVFVDSKEELEQFSCAGFYSTTTQPELVENGLIHVNPSMLRDPKLVIPAGESLKARYGRLAELMEKQNKLHQAVLKVGYEKNLLGKERRKIRKLKDGGNIHKYFMERKK